MSKLGANNKKMVGFPKMTARENWGKYLLGMGTEVLYALFLAAVTLGIAALAMVIFK